MAIITKNGEQTYTGVCLFPQQSSSIMDSYYTDYGMIVYNMEKGSFDTIWYGSDRNDNMPHATVDASPEMFAKWEALQTAQREARYAREELTRVMTPERGKRLEVIRGRKVPHGTIGDCFWIGNNGYGVSVGIKDNAGKVYFTSIDNVQVI